MIRICEGTDFGSQSFVSLKQKNDFSQRNPTSCPASRGLSLQSRAIKDLFSVRARNPVALYLVMTPSGEAITSVVLGGCLSIEKRIWQSWCRPLASVHTTR